MDILHAFPRAFHSTKLIFLAFCLSIYCEAGLAERVIPDTSPFPQPDSVKGLQVQMTDDAISLGIKHAAINVNLSQLLDLTSVHQQGTSIGINHSYVQHLDAQIKPLSDHGIIVYLILLAYPHANEAIQSLLIHPNAEARHEYQVGAFNTITEEGKKAYHQLLAFLANRYSSSHSPHGRVWGYIIGNEVNSQYTWYHLGNMPLTEAIANYHQAVRMAHDAIRIYSQHARVYLSFDHHWNTSMPNATDQQAYPAKAFLDGFARLAKEHGDFEWHVAHHPYPDDLGNPKTWLDRLALPSNDSPHITFKNLQVAVAYMKQPHLLWKGEPRRIILSEQGIHCLPSDDGEDLQAAGFAYAWEKTNRCQGIDALIWHRHVDHAHEGGLRLGLWENQPGTVAEPKRPRRIHELFKQAGTKDWEQVSSFALPLIGIKNWNDLR